MGPCAIINAMHLAENIHAYYLTNLARLSPEKQFHFCSRIGAWLDDPVALQHLAEMRGQYIPSSSENLQQELANMVRQPVRGLANANTLREPYFRKYPWLRGLELALFRVRHLRTMYGIDGRVELLNIVPRQQLEGYVRQLLADPQALRILSTYAINFIYLVERQMLGHTNPRDIDATMLYNLINGYDLSDPLQLQLLFYLYTHCIIADTNFYVAKVPEDCLPDYRAMLQKLDELILDNVAQLSLDTKLEFLVCCRICRYDAKCTELIYKECETSLSPDGMFLIDTHNSFANRNGKKTFAASEHRNVLYIMSTHPYEPRPFAIRQAASE